MQLEFPGCSSFISVSPQVSYPVVGTFAVVIEEWTSQLPLLSSSSELVVLSPSFPSLFFLFPPSFVQLLPFMLRLSLLPLLSSFASPLLSLVSSVAVLPSFSFSLLRQHLLSISLIAPLQ